MGHLFAHKSSSVEDRSTEPYITTFVISNMLVYKGCPIKKKQLWFVCISQARHSINCFSLSLFPMQKGEKIKKKNF